MKPIIENLRQQQKKEKTESANKFWSSPGNLGKESERRHFLKKTVLGGIGLSSFMGYSFEDTLAETTKEVNRYSAPSELKITDLRYAKVRNWPMLRIDTNQGIYGLGEVRDGGDPRYALMLKSRILGQNPCNVEKLFKQIKQFGGPARQAGGVCGVEMALWDICGKAYNVPAWQLLGGRYRDKVRLYADTPEADSPDEQKKLIEFRVKNQGYSWLKMDVSIDKIAHIPGTLVNADFWKNDKGELRQWGDQRNYMSYANTKHPFTQIQVTEKGLDELARIVEEVRNMVGYEIPLSTDHYGHFDLNNGIRMAKKLDKYRLAWLEDMVPWQYTEQWKTLSDAFETPTTTGEDIHYLENFKPLIHNRAVDIVHPDLASSGGLLETKRIGDYAEEYGMAMAMHQAGSPITFMANVHCAAATQNFLALEHHSVDLPWWEDLVTMTGKQKMIENGYALVPDTAPGLGIELNEDVVKEHLNPKDKTYFAPTEEWNELRSHDRTYS